MSYRVHVAYAWNGDRYDVHIADVGPDGVYVVKPYAMVMERTPDGVETPAALSLPTEMARALYDALGAALGIHTPDARMAAEVLAREQDRVDKMIDHLILPPSRPHALDRPF